MVMIPVACALSHTGCYGIENIKQKISGTGKITKIIYTVVEIANSVLDNLFIPQCQWRVIQI